MRLLFGSLTYAHDVIWTAEQIANVYILQANQKSSDFMTFFSMASRALFQNGYEISRDVEKKTF